MKHVASPLPLALLCLHLAACGAPAPPASETTAPTPAAAAPDTEKTPIFAEGFESGTMDKWQPGAGHSDAPKADDKEKEKEPEKDGKPSSGG